MKLFARASVALALAACGSSDQHLPDSDGGPDQRPAAIAPAPTPPPVAAKPSAKPEPVASQPTTAPKVGAPAKAADPDRSVLDIAKAHNAFGFDLWKALADDFPDNFALSPVSLSVAFDMTYGGARGVTADEMRKVLHLDGVADPHGATGKALDLWSAGDRPYALRLANRLFGEQTAPFEAPFLDLMKTAYRAPLEKVDFKTAFEPSRVHINDWVAKNTEDKIKDLLPLGSLDDTTRLVLVNAIYFKGQWVARFDKAKTHDDAFHAPKGDVKVPFMEQQGVFKIAGSEIANIVELPYVGGDLAMDVVLPRGDSKSLAGFDQAALDVLVQRLRPEEETTVILPRFKLETPSVSLKKDLMDLGMKTAFGSDADLTGMSPLDLYIDDAFHKVFVEVNEEGTEAAAATAVIVNEESARMPFTFKADKPFMFFIRDTRTGHILFMGRVVNPAV